MSSAEKKNEKSSWISSAVEKFVAQMPKRDSDNESDDSQDWMELVKEGDQPELCGMHLANICNAGSEDVTLSARCIKCKVQRKYLLKVIEFENDTEHWERLQKRAAVSSVDASSEAEDKRMQLTPTSKDNPDKNSCGDDGKEVLPFTPKRPPEIGE